MSFIYPPKMLKELKTAWDKVHWSVDSKTPLPSQMKLQELLEVAFHASLLTEEQRRLRFRISYCDPSTIDKTLPRHGRSVAIRFDAPRPFNVAEILRLAPAADSIQVLIGVFDKVKLGVISMETNLAIWGMIDTGLSWWEFTRGESTHGAPPPDYFTISSNEPGRMTISRGGLIVLTLRRGDIVKPTSGVFYSGPIGEYLDQAANKFHKAVCKKLNVDKYDLKGHDEEYPQSFFVQFIERILGNIRQRNHGGTILMVPDELNMKDTRLTDRVLIKYPCEDFRAWSHLLNYICSHKKYYNLLFKSWKPKQVPQEVLKLLGMLESESQEAEELVRDQAHFLASLTGVDGALILSNLLRVIGFGAEVIVPSPTLQMVKIAEESSGRDGSLRPIDSFGTRHRSALRFCSSYEDSVALIVSQDGDIRTAKRIGPDVVLWSGIDIGYLGL